mgnify:CR=1 FL=1
MNDEKGLIPDIWNQTNILYSLVQFCCHKHSAHVDCIHKKLQRKSNIHIIEL